MILVVVVVAVIGCSSTGKGEDKAIEPASVEAIDGTSVGQVTLTQEAADRIGLKTERAQSVSVIGKAKSTHTVVPLAAVLYDKDGISWVYTNPKPLTYLRQRVVIDSVDGDSVVLRSGPAPGTSVVTVGGAELLGTEYVVEGE